MSAGLTHAAAVADTGDLFTWDVSTDGTGNASGLGHLNLVDGNAAIKKIPQSVHTLKRVTAVACGDTHTAVVVTLSRPRLETIEGLKGEVDDVKVERRLKKLMQMKIALLISVFTYREGQMQRILIPF